MAKISFLIQSKINPVNIYVRLTSSSDLIDIKTKTNIVINFKDWSQKKQTAINLRLEAHRNIDASLQKIKSELIDHFNNSNETKNLEWLKNFINPKPKNTIPDKLIEFIDFYLFEKEMNLNTHKKINVVKNKLVKIQTDLNKKYLVKDINLSFRKEFLTWNKKNGYSDNTVFSNLQVIKTICNYAYKKDIQISKELNDIKAVEKKAESIYLTFEELEKIEKVEIKNNLLINARDWLIISCYTGQRVADFMRLNKTMIRYEKSRKDGINKPLIEFTQEKTNMVMTVPLHGKVMEILQKRDGEFPDKMFSQKYNGYIKKVCEIAKLDELVHGGKMIKQRKVFGIYPKWQLVSSHIGRRSFATNFYGIIPTPLLMNATGHKKESTFLIYIGKSSSDMAMELSNYF